MKKAIIYKAIKNSICLVMLTYGTLASAHVFDPFTPRFNETIYGDFTMIANNMISRTSSGDFNGWEDNQYFYDLVYVDIDGFVDGITDSNDPSLNIDFDIELKDDCYFLEDNCDLSFDLQFTANYNGVQDTSDQSTVSSNKY